ncbi:MAG: hypothetical protein ABTR07_08335 [Candidatus Competibacter denitrificans]
MNASIKSLALQSLNVALRLLLGALWTVVKTAVQVMEVSEMSGAEKRERVFAIAQQEAINLGKNFSSSLINLGIEAAVQLLKGGKSND